MPPPPPAAKGKGKGKAADAPPPPPPVKFGRKGAPPPPPPPAPRSRVAMASAAAAKGLPKLPNVSSVKMENQHVYQIPEEVRMEIFELKTKYKFSNAELACAVGKSGGANPGQAVGRFLNATGDFSGEQMDIYVPVSHFVEKMRIHEKRPKSQKRKELEKEASSRPDKKPNLGSDPNKRGAKAAIGAAIARGALPPAGAGASAPPPPPSGKGKAKGKVVPKAPGKASSAKGAQKPGKSGGLMASITATIFGGGKS